MGFEPTITDLEGFMGETFSVERKCPFSLLKETMIEMGAGRAIIRYETPDYYGTRNKLEKDLEGRTDVHIFRNGDTALLSVKLDP